MPDRADAQKRVDQIHAFRAELAALKAAGRSPFTTDQETAVSDFHDRELLRLAAEYDIDRSERAGQLSAGMRLLSFFGAVTLTAAIYSLVARFWGRFDLPSQATLLAAFPLVALIGVELSARRERTLYIASLFALVAYGSFWLAVGVLSETLNVPVMPIFIWAGALFGLALALPYGFRVVLAVALTALAVAIPASLLAVAGLEWPLLFDRLELVTAAGFSLIVLSFPLVRVNRSFPAVTRLVGFFIGLLGLLVLSLNGRMSLLPVSPRASEVAYQALMFVVSVAVLVVSIRWGWRETLRLAAVMLTLFLLTRYLDWFWELLPRYVFFLILAAVAFASLVILRRFRARLAEAA
jgi:hypothetical protein